MLFVYNMSIPIEKLYAEGHFYDYWFMRNKIFTVNYT